MAILSRTSISAPSALYNRLEIGPVMRRIAANWKLPELETVILWAALSGSLPNTLRESESPGLLIVQLLGYGRKIGADLQVLSWFRLWAVQLASTMEAEDPTPLYLKRSLGSFSYGRLLDAKWIDSSIGYLWLRQCESRHGPECNEHGWTVAMEKPKLLRVVNIQDYCIKSVAESTTCRYIALSYVWGRAKMVKLLYLNMGKLDEEKRPP